MEAASTSEEDVVLIYIRLMRKESPEAAAVLEQIRRQSGDRIALRAALSITLLKQEIRRYHSLPDISVYTYLLKEFPEAIPLLQQAMTCCLASWGMLPMDENRWGKWQQNPGAPQDPFRGLLERVRQHSPITSVKLEQIYKNYGPKAGGYAATALIWFEARVTLFGSKTLVELPDKDIQAFPYFQYMRRREEALDQFIVMLDCYRIERRPTSSSAFSAEHDALQNEQQAAKEEDNP